MRESLLMYGEQGRSRGQWGSDIIMGGRGAFIIGIMEKKMAASIVYWGEIGVMGKNMEALYD